MVGVALAAVDWRDEWTLVGSSRAITAKARLAALPAFRERSPLFTTTRPTPGSSGSAERRRLV